MRILNIAMSMLLFSAANAFVPKNSAFSFDRQCPAGWDRNHNGVRGQKSGSAWSSLCRGASTRIFQSASPEESAIQIQENMYLELATKGEGVIARPEMVYIMMYNPGTAQEGVHTTEFPKGSGSEVMLAFESLDECAKFSNMLKEDQNFPLEPVPTPTPLEQMEMACQQMDLQIKVVPAEG